MTIRPHSFAVLQRTAAIAFIAGYCATACLADPPADSVEFYKLKVEPLLKTACYECHSHATGEASGKLMVDSLTAMTDGGTRGSALKAGKPDESLILKAVSYADPDLQMPPDGQLPADQIEILRTWIAAGAVAPKSDAQSATPQKMSPEAIAATHWAYQPPQPFPLLQSTVGVESTTSTIDAILLSKLAASGLTFSPRADRPTLLRRLHYDLTGLPPTAEEIEAFTSDSRSDSELIESTVDRLLTSSHFGERWARYWMDVSRYADTKGYVFTEDRQYPEAYRYRDWLVDAFNSDMPYNEFVRKQLAADIDPTATEKDLPALGFLTLGRRFLNNKQDIIDDRLDVVSRGLMGMTLACARCHDHKYDPVSQADYYALYGVFLNTDEPGGDPFPHRLADSKEDRKSHILLRGNPGNRGDEVPRRFVSFLSPQGAPFDAAGSGRVQLAARIVDPKNPLTARVIANRIWLRLMGASLVESPSDFGTRCPAPVQQALLDQMAFDFMRGGWSIKQLVRTIALSNVYQQRSLHRDDASQIDPTNALYWRANRRRRDFESLRDALLSVSGQLDSAVHGKPEKITERPFPHRRTVYAYIDRQNLPNVFRSFDFASPDSHNPARPYTSVPQQSLFLLNSDFVAELATDLGNTAKRDANSPEAVSSAVGQLFRQVLGRVPAEDERQAMVSFITSANSASEQARAPESLERWIYGYGSFDAANKTLANFQRLPKFTGGAWQGGDALPDSKLGWSTLNAAGGHPGNDGNFAVSKRWIAPRNGKLRVTGKIQHKQNAGDGVRATVLVDGGNSIGQWTAKNAEAKTNCELILIMAGQKIDFVTDCIGDANSDSFTWRIRLRYEDGGREEFDAERQFPQPPQQPLDRWQQLAQALLASNEFAFVD